MKPAIFARYCCCHIAYSRSQACSSVREPHTWQKKKSRIEKKVGDLKKIADERKKVADEKKTIADGKKKIADAEKKSCG